MFQHSAIIKIDNTKYLLLYNDTYINDPRGNKTFNCFILHEPTLEGKYIHNIQFR